MNYKKLIVEKFHLIENINIYHNYYKIEEGKYIFFLNKIIDKDSINETLLDNLKTIISKNDYSKWKTIIIFGKTSVKFTKKDLTYFDGEDTAVVLYLVDEANNMQFYDGSWSFIPCLNNKKLLNSINQIINEFKKTN